MKRYLFILVGVMLAFSASAQTLLGDANSDGVVTMTDANRIVNYYTNGSAEGIDLVAADATKDGSVTMSDANAVVNIYVGGSTGSSLADNNVAVVFNGATATVDIADNIANQIAVQVTGAHVTMLQSPALLQEITYTLSGSSAEGSFYMDGEFKASVVLNGLTLANPDSAAINIANGKRIAVVLQEGTVNTLTDGIKVADDGSDAHNACFYVNGHTEFQGAGSLVINGKVKHGFTSDEYCQVKAGTGSITVASAPGDGFHIGQYLWMQGGTISITCQGDGIDVGAKKDTTLENNGKIILDNGKITVLSSGLATKGLKCDGSMDVNSGEYTVTVSGNAVYDSTVAEISSSAAAKCGASFTMSGGVMTLLATGSGGKGVNATGALSVTGGVLTATTCGATFVNGAVDSKPQGLKSDTNITISGGEVYVAASKSKGSAFKPGGSFFANGGKIMGIGGKASSASTASKQIVKKYSAVNVTAGATITYNGVSFTVPAQYSNNSAYVLVSAPSM